MDSFDLPFQLRDFEVVRLIGEGSYGAVKEIKHKVTAVRCALKSVCYENTTQKRRAIQEAKLMSVLAHVNVVKMYGAFDAPKASTYHIRLELCLQGTIADVIEARKGVRMPEIQIWLYTVDLLEGLKYLHDSSTAGGAIVHLDVKPENLLIHNNRVKIADFGVSEVVGDATGPGGYIGTREYSAPEVLRDEAYGVEADIYSAGIVVFELILLVSPFQPEVINSSYRKGDFSPRSLPTSLSHDLRTLVPSMLNIESPKDRPTAASILAAYHSCAFAQELIKAREEKLSVVRAAQSQKKAFEAEKKSLEDRVQALCDQMAGSSLREAAVADREVKVEVREVAVQSRETRADEKEADLKRREDEVAAREKAAEIKSLPISIKRPLTSTTGDDKEGGEAKKQRVEENIGSSWGLRGAAGAVIKAWTKSE